MKPFYRSHTISFLLFLGSISLYVAGDFLNKKSEDLKEGNAERDRAIKALKNISKPEKYLAFLEKRTEKNLPKQLDITAQKHHLSIEKNMPLPENKIEITLQGDLDTDIFAYLQEISENFLSTLSLQEMGIFRDQNNVMGKVLFETFPQGAP